MSRIRVLLVDDNAKFLRLATRYLEEHDDIQVVGSLEGGEEALARLDDLRPDVVVIDLVMPGVSGLDAIPRLRAARPDTAIVALTLLGPEGYREAALAAGADAFVSKMQLAQALLPAIRRSGEGAPPAGRGPRQPEGA